MPLLHMLLIAFLCFVAYSNSFEGYFHFDDEFYITKNKIIKEPRYFLNPSDASDLTQLWEYHTLNMRYMGMLSFAINNYIHGTDVTGYHIVNFAIHLANAFLIYWLITATCMSPEIRGRCTCIRPGLVAFFSALAFACHPIQTQAVSYLSQRFASLATLFWLSSVLLYGRSRLTAGTTLRIILYFAALTTSVCAMKTKEISFTMPVVIIIYELLFFRGNAKKRFILLAPFVLIMLIIPLNLVLNHEDFDDIALSISEATRAQSEISRWEYFVTQTRVIPTYVRLLLLPVNQNLDYDYPLFSSMFGPSVLPYFLLMAALTFCIGILCLKTRDGNVRREFCLISFGFSWFIISLLVESSIIPTRDLIFEHRLYLPSAGAIMAMVVSAFVIGSGLRHGWRRKLFVGVMAVIVMLMLPATHMRNEIWKDETSLWEDVVRKSPNKPRGFVNLGKAYLEDGRLDSAISCLHTSLMLDPENAFAHNTLGLAYVQLNEIETGKIYYREALRLDPDYEEAMFNLGIAHLEEGLNDIARNEFAAVLSMNPYQHQARIFLAYLSR